MPRLDDTVFARLRQQHIESQQRRNEQAQAQLNLESSRSTQTAKDISARNAEMRKDEDAAFSRQLKLAAQGGQLSGLEGGTAADYESARVQEAAETGRRAGALERGQRETSRQDQLAAAGAKFGQEKGKWEARAEERRGLAEYGRETQEGLAGDRREHDVSQSALDREAKKVNAEIMARAGQTRAAGVVGGQEEKHQLNIYRAIVQTLYNAERALPEWTVTRAQAREIRDLKASRAEAFKLLYKRDMTEEDIRQAELEAVRAMAGEVRTGGAEPTPTGVAYRADPPPVE